MAGKRMRTEESGPPTARRRRRRIHLTVAGLFALILGLPLLGYVGPPTTGAQPAEEGPRAEQGFPGGDNPRSNYWGAVREGVEGTTTVEGVGMTTLIQNSGEIYREVRNGPLATYGAGLMGLMLVGLIGFYLIRGSIRLKEGRSGAEVPRFSGYERGLHWTVAVLFILLAVTGLILLYGRAFLIPVLGPGGFAASADLSKSTHNFLGPVFVVALVLMLIHFFRDNIPRLKDFRGLLRSRDKGIGRFNLFEKGWFWLILVAGLVVAVTGLILDFPLFDQSRFAMQLSQILHAVGGVLLITGALGHIYMGTVGMEGSLEGMTSGSVDANWAREHHDGWYDEMKQAGRVEPAAPSGEQGSEVPGASR